MINVQTLPVGIPMLTPFSDIKTQKIEWLWPGRIPQGKLTVLAGDPGLGKSLMSVAIAAALTEEAKWPDCHEYAPSGSVVILSAEDLASDTTKPRLVAAGGDVSKVYSMESIVDLGNKKRGLSLDRDIDKLKIALDTVPDCKLFIIDPISAFMGAVDSHNVADVRGVLAPLTSLAQDRNIAVLYITHLNKGQGTPMSRISGSGAYVAAARSAMLVGRDPTNPERRVVVSLKSNLSREPEGIAYRIESNEEDLPVLHWFSDPVDMSAEDLLSAKVSQAKGDAKEFLHKELNGGSVLSNVLKEKAAAEGIAWRTIERAKVDLKIRSKKMPEGWIWAM